MSEEETPHRARAAPGTTQAGAERALLVSITLFALIVLVIHFASSLPGFSWMWGAHFYSFFSPAWLYGAMLLVVAAIAAILITKKIPARMLAETGSWRLVGVAVAAGGFLFWTFRICHTYLGDGSVLVQEIDSYQHLLPREPLTSLLQRGVYAATHSWFVTPGRAQESVAQDALAVGSVVCGCLFLVVAWLLAGELARLARGDDDRVERKPLTFTLWLVLITQGYVQLFFGYVENYSFQAVGTVLFLAASLRYLRGACALVWPALALCACVALHFSSMLLGAPFLVLVVAGLRSKPARRAALRDLAIAGALSLVVLLFAAREYNPLATLTNMFRTAFASRLNPGYMFTGIHYRDFLNEQLLIGPLGMFLFLGTAAGVIALRRLRHPAVVFSLLAGVTFLAACWMIGDSNLGYARDWDMLAHTGIVFTVTGLALLMALRMSRATMAATLSIAVLVSVFHTAPWIATNARETTSLARLETLPLGLGRTEVMLAWWYDRKGDVAMERAWLHRSIVVFNGNASAYYMLGVLDMNDRNYTNAIGSFQRMVALRPDKVEFRGQLAHAYFLADRFGEATPDLQFIVSRQPDNTMAVFYLGEALEQAGRCDDALQMFLRAEPLCRAASTARPHDSAAAATYGWVQFRLGQDDESLCTLEHATALASPAPIASCYLGHVLQKMGHNEDARVRYIDCVTTDAEVGDRGKIESWLAETGGPPQY